MKGLQNYEQKSNKEMLLKDSPEQMNAVIKFIKRNIHRRSGRMDSYL